MSIDPNGVYTPGELEQLLKVSKSTVKRLLKKGLIRANKLGGQYRILGHEILLAISPQADKKATAVYQNVKKKAQARVKHW